MEKLKQSRNYNTGLTRQMLNEWGITIEWDDVTNDWKVTRYVEYYCKGVTNGKGKHVKTTNLTKHTNITLHPNGEDKYYQYYTFSVDGKSKTVTLARLLHAYFKGDIPEGYEVDHIDDNSFNNNLANLQILTPTENKAKRKNKYGRHTPKGDK